MRADKAHCNLVNDYSVERPLLRVAEGGRLLKLSFARSQAAEWNDELFYDRGGIRGKCKGFSFGSRRRMLDRLNSVSVGASLPYFVTMTLPDEVFCDQVGEFAKRAKVWLQTWLKRLGRVSPKACGFWRIEWKARESGAHVGKLFPHFHLLIWGLLERSLGEHWSYSKLTGQLDAVTENFESYVDLPDYQLTLNLLDLWNDASKAKKLDDVPCRSESDEGRVFAGSRRFVERARSLEVSCMAAQMFPGEHWGDTVRKMSFQDWASLAWYHVVGSQNLDHVQAGVRVERVRTWGGVMSYCSKYMAKADAEFMAEIAWGRSWGVFNRECVPWARIVEIELDNEVGVRLRRVARHYLERRFGRRVRAPYGVTVYCDVSQFRRLWEVSPVRDPF